MMQQWHYDELRHCGVDYAKAEEAETYDAQHQQFRDYEKEFGEMMAFLGLEDAQSKTVIDLGCGTGATALYAAEVFKKVYAVDISEVMIEQARKKLGAESANVTFVKAGFLGYEHEGEPADLVMTKAALHHLPDFWKQVALMRMNAMLRPGGRLYIHDVVFQFEPQEYAEKIEAWIGGFERVAGAAFRADVETHIRDEYSTFGWVLEGMLEKAGFVVEKRRSNDGFVTEYACRKVAEAGV